MNEEQTKHEKITPALKAAGWDCAPFKLALEQQVAPGRIEHMTDGFLTPYRVKQCHSTLAQYHYEVGDRVSNGEELDQDKYYSNDELEKDRIRIKARDRHFVKELFTVMPADEKALVFCVTQEHALRITRIIREEAARRGIHASGGRFL